MNSSQRAEGPLAYFLAPGDDLNRVESCAVGHADRLGRLRVVRAAPLVQERRPTGVTWLTFNRPDRLNSFTAADYRDLRVALNQCAADDATQVAVITGRGRAFSAGADRSLLDPTDTDRIDAREEFAAGAEGAAFKQTMRQLEHERGGIDRLVSNYALYRMALERVNTSDGSSVSRSLKSRPTTASAAFSSSVRC